MNKLFKWVLVICWMAVIYLFSNMPNDLSQQVSQATLKRIETISSEEKGNIDDDLEVSMVVQEAVKTEKISSTFSFKKFFKFSRPTHINGNYIIRKAAHVFEYFLLCILIFYAMNTGKLRKRTLLFGFIMCMLFSFGDEFHQSFVPGRTCSFKDCMFDVFGALLGCIMCYVLVWTKKTVKTIISD